MLTRMYTRWAERHGYGLKVLDYLDGMKPARRSEKNSFDAALEKLRDFYLSTYRTARFGL